MLQRKFKRFHFLNQFISGFFHFFQNSFSALLYKFQHIQVFLNIHLLKCQRFVFVITNSLLCFQFLYRLSKFIERPTIIAGLLHYILKSSVSLKSSLVGTCEGKQPRNRFFWPYNRGVVVSHEMKCSKGRTCERRPFINLCKLQRWTVSCNLELRMVQAIRFAVSLLRSCVSIPRSHFTSTYRMFVWEP